MNNIQPAEIIARWARHGARLGYCGKMCRECAFKSNALGNTEPHNVEKALQAITWDGQFNCHIGNNQDAGYACAGFLYAKQYLEKRFNPNHETSFSALLS